MANKQIHELAAVEALGADDLILLSTHTANETRKAPMSALPVRVEIDGAIERRAGSRAADNVSVMDFGAVGDGIADDAASFTAALTSAASSVFVPAGRYRLGSGIILPQGKRLNGAGKQSAVLVGDHTGPLLTTRPDAAGMGRCSIENLAFELSASGEGIQALGEDILLDALQFSGGQASAWAIDCMDARGIKISGVSMGGPGRDFFANGIRWRNANPAIRRNFGDSTIMGIDIRLGAANTTAIHLAGADGGLINNMLVAHARLRAPQSGATPFAGSTGILLDSTVRSTFLGVALEAIENGIVENGTSSALGASVGNQYFGVSAISVANAYADSNTAVARSVQQRIFAGCDNFPASTGLNDGDTVMPAGLWLQSFVNGENAVRMRCFSGHEMIIDDGEERGSLSLDVGGSSPRLSPKEAGLLVRLYLGRSSTPSNNTMRDVTIEPVLRLAPRDSQNPGATTGQLVYADGTNWNPGQGEGFYAFERGTWRKLAFVNP